MTKDNNATHQTTMNTGPYSQWQGAPKILAYGPACVVNHSLNCSSRSCASVCRHELLFSLVIKVVSRRKVMCSKLTR